MKQPSECFVLVVEDAEDMREAISRQLKHVGFRVLTADCGTKAKQIIGREHVDVILTDVQMSGGDGIDLLQWVKKRHPSIFVFLMSGNPMIEVFQDFEADGSFTKPFAFDLLIDTVREVCRKSA